LAEQEVADRLTRRRERRLKEAKFPVVKQLDSFDFALLPSLEAKKVAQLQEGGYIDETQSVICIGAPGLGKTHIATALGVAAAQQTRRVRFYNAAGLVNELTAAQEAGKLQLLLNRAVSHDLIILDELGFIPFTQKGAQLIFQFCSAVYERTSLIITTNLPFAQWTQVFGDEQLTVALLDRLTHRAHILEFVGDSYRFRQRLTQSAQAPNVGLTGEEGGFNG
jgi:DNA replication protein DnaC